MRFGGEHATAAMYVHDRGMPHEFLVQLRPLEIGIGMTRSHSSTRGRRRWRGEGEAGIGLDRRLGQRHGSRFRRCARLRHHLPSIAASGSRRFAAPISRWQWNGGFGAHSGPSRVDLYRRAFRPLRTIGHERLALIHTARTTTSSPALATRTTAGRRQWAPALILGRAVALLFDRKPAWPRRTSAASDSKTAR